MFDSILGGGEWIVSLHVYDFFMNHVTAEAVLGDLGVRQALKDMPNNVRL